MNSTDIFSLEGETVLVVGAGGDLGRRSALVAGRLGARVTVADYEGARTVLEETVAILHGEGIEADVLVCDVTSETSVDNCVRMAAAGH